MAATTESYIRVDQEFDEYLADMKPHVLKLPHKTDRQKCAVWIKKLCAPASGISGRKNRNMYASLMLHMLKRGVLEDPFSSKPSDGPLPTLPPYMSIYFDEPATNKGSDRVPSWVAGELTSSVGSTLFRPTLGTPAASSTWNLGISPIRPDRSPRRRPHTSLGIDLDNKDPVTGLSCPSFSNRIGAGLFSLDDMSINERKDSSTDLNFLLGDIPGPVTRTRKKDDREVRIDSAEPKSKIDIQSEHILSETSSTDTDWSRPLGLASTATNTYFRGSTMLDEPLFSAGSKDMEMKSKMLEAKFYEEKLRLQQKHDAAVQKILDRKNAEIEELKSHYREKMREMEQTNAKLEQKIQSYLKELQVVKETKDNQIAELRKMVQETNESKKYEFEKRINDLVAEFEQEKFDMQKQHTRSMQEILENTNIRLEKMEKEYKIQTASTNGIIQELEAQLQRLTAEVDHTTKAKTVLEKEKIELESKLDRLNSELQDLRDRCIQLEKEHQRALEMHEQELHSLKKKTDANLVYLKQEHNMASSKASEAISEMNSQIDHLRRMLKDAETQRQKQIRDMEQVQLQDKMHLENLHDKQIRAMKKEVDQLEQESQKKIHQLQQNVKDKEDEIQKLGLQSKHQAEQANNALGDFKMQVERNQTQMFEDMKQQMERVESDLNKSKGAREKQSREFAKQMDEKQLQHEREITELKVALEQEKGQMLHDLHQQRELAFMEQEKELENAKDSHQTELRDVQANYQDRQNKDIKKQSLLEHQVQDLREEVVQANQLRKQQLVELGLLREEEKQKMQRDHESRLAKMTNESEQQRLDLQKTHSLEMENMLSKTNDRLKDIEREYAERGHKASDAITELQSTMNQLREETSRVKEKGDKKLTDSMSRFDDEKKSIRKQYTTNLETMQKDLETEHSNVRASERRIDKLEGDHETKITKLKLAYEEKMKGLMPAIVRQELEDTIDALRSQVNSLQQKSMLLQEEIDMHSKFPIGTFGRKVLQ